MAELTHDLPKLPISVAIITKDEEHDIRRALDSVKNFAQIIIVDSFSTDNTISIAKEYTTHIYQHRWPGFAKQKQQAIDYATYPWVLILDADECVTTELAREMSTAIANTQYQGYYLPRKNMFLGKWIQHCGWANDFTLRLFQKACSQMEEREVHEKVLVSGNVGKLSAYIEHYSHQDLTDYLLKTNHYATLAAAQMTKDGRRASLTSLLFNPCYAFIKIYLLKQGFRDGIRGFMIAVLFGFSTFLKYAKLWEKQPARNAQ